MARTADLDAAMATIPLAAGPAIAARRGALAWRIGVPADGALPCDGAMPTMIEWPDAGPLRAMPDSGLRLLALHVAHPRADAIREALDGRLIDTRTTFENGPCGLRATFETPHGEASLL